MKSELFKIFDELFEGVIAIDDRNRVVYMNREAERITGFRLSEAERRKCYEVLRSSLCKDRCPIELSKKGEGNKTFEPDILTKESRMKKLRLKVFRFEDLWIEIFTDTTREYELEKTLKGNYFLFDIITKNKKLL